MIDLLIKDGMMNRLEAIDVIVESDLSAVSEAERYALLLDWWSLDEDDDHFSTLPEALREKMKRDDEPDVARDPQYDALLRVALRHRFVGVRNEYLSSRLASLGSGLTTVQGDVEVLEACPCCGYRTLAERGGYEICRVCFWEDDGSRELDCVSGPNHMTLREGRESFARFGAVSEDAAGHVLADGPLRFERG